MCVRSDGALAVASEFMLIASFHARDFSQP